jgi:hypothetical protein
VWQAGLWRVSGNVVCRSPVRIVSQEGVLREEEEDLCRARGGEMTRFESKVLPIILHHKDQTAKGDRGPRWVVPPSDPVMSVKQGGSFWPADHCIVQPTPSSESRGQDAGRKETRDDACLDCTSRSYVFPTYQVQADEDRNVPKVMPVMAKLFTHI